jgi:methylaspartate ammonia-lyase
MRTPTTRFMVEMPVDLGNTARQLAALLRLATMLEHGNRIVGDRWHIVIDESAGTIRLIPQP